jgi:hypothetical protein
MRGSSMQQREPIGTAAGASDELTAEDRLAALRRRFAQTDDPDERSELAAEALDYVESQLELMREQRQRLDSDETKLWASRHRIERMLIDSRGRDWWLARRARARARALAST